MRLRVRGGEFPALVLMALAAMVVVLPLAVHGCSCGHDFDFHLVSWFEAAAQFGHGVVLPRWAQSPGWDAGEPRFVFYPPLSWVLGALLGWVLPWGAVPVAYTWLALVAAGAGMYRLGRVFAGEGAATLAAMVYVANPYMMFTAVERTAYAELLAAAWIPMALAAGLRTKVRIWEVAAAVALLWLTNAPAAVMGCYALAVIAVVRVVFGWRAGVVEFAGRMIAGVALGLGAAAFYVLPAAYERRWVEIRMAMVEGMRIGDNFLFHHTTDALHDEVLRTASWIAVGMLVAAGVVLGRAVWAERAVGGSGRLLPQTRPTLAAKDAAKMGHPGLRVVALGVLAGVIAGMLTPGSAEVWRVAPELAFLQFPWRLVAVLAAVVCAGLAAGLGRSRALQSPRRLVVGVVGLGLVAAISWPGVKVFRQGCDDEDTVAARRAVFAARTGTDPTDEYTPLGADNDVLGHADPPYWLGKDADAAAPAGARPGPVEERFTVNSAKAQMLVLNLRAYPAWRVRVNGATVDAASSRADGLIAVPVAKGMDRVEIAYERTEDEWVGLGVSGASLLIFMGMGAAAWPRRRAGRLGEPGSVIIES